MKRRSTGWEKIFVHYIFDKGFVSRTYKEVLKLNIKRQLISKMGKGSQQVFLQIKSENSQYAPENHFIPSN